MKERGKLYFEVQDAFERIKMVIKNAKKMQVIQIAFLNLTKIFDCCVFFFALTDKSVRISIDNFFGGAYLSEVPRKNFSDRMRFRFAVCASVDSKINRGPSAKSHHHGSCGQSSTRQRCPRPKG